MPDYYWVLRDSGIAYANVYIKYNALHGIETTERPSDARTFWTREEARVYAVGHGVPRAFVPFPMGGARP